MSELSNAFLEIARRHHARRIHAPRHLGTISHCRVCSVDTVDMAARVGPRERVICGACQKIKRARLP